MDVSPAPPKAWTVVAHVLIWIAPVFPFLGHGDYLTFDGVTLPLLLALSLVGVLSALVSLLFGQTWWSLGTASALLLFADFQFEPTIPMLGVIWIVAAVVVWLFRRHAAEILSVVFGTLIVAVCATTWLETRQPPITNQPGDQSLPPIVHIILDEHIGVAGFKAEDDEVRTKVSEFYLSQGFDLWTEAYSHYAKTDDSISNLFNYTASDLEKIYFVDFDEPRILQKNKHFEELADKGYNISVFQTDWLDLCSGPKHPQVRCRTHNYTNISALEESNLPLSDKAWVVSTMYLLRSAAYRHLGKLYRKLYNALGRPAALTKWNWNRQLVGALAVPSVFHEFGDEIVSSSSGRVFVIHVLLPHAPYVFDASCREKRVAEWTNGYAEQVTCSLILIGKLLKRFEETGMYEDSMIIVHGDHGSRKTRMKLRGSNIDKLSHRDLVEGYSTLFAVKPAGRASYRMGTPDSELRSIQELFKNLFQCELDECNEQRSGEATLFFGNRELHSKMRRKNVDLFPISSGVEN